MCSPKLDWLNLPPETPPHSERQQPAGFAGKPARVLAFVNQKGGVGKTTSTVNIAAMLAHQHLRVLIVDIDPQGNATSSLGIDKQSLDQTLYETLVDRVDVQSVVVPTGLESVDLLPATPMLAGAEIELVDYQRREHRLADALKRVTSDYDIILIDSPPSLGLLTVNALTAATHVIIPVQCEYLALEGVSQVLGTIDLVRRNLNPRLDLLGVLMTMYDSRTRLSGHVVDEVRSFFPDHLFSTVIPRSVRLAEAPSFGQVIDEYDAGSPGARAYADVAVELTRRLTTAI
jgi:chromosome partitioning protein